MPLPGKDVFTIPELIERWKWWGCGRATLLSYARQNSLCFAVYLRNIGSHRRKEKRADGDYVVTSTVMKFTSPGRASGSPIRFLASEDARRIFEAAPNERIAVSVLYATPERTKDQATGYAQPLYFTVDDLVVTREERARFEREHKLRGPRHLLRRSWGWLSDGMNQRTLTLVGGAIAAAIAAAWALYVKLLAP
jgi:hypothetical protein